MSAAHWLIPPPSAPMGSRPLPGVPAIGHTLDPRRCPACGASAPPRETATPRRPAARPAPIAAKPTPKPEPVVVPPKPARKEQAPRVDVSAPDEALQAAASAAVRRFGKRLTADLCSVTQDTLHKILRGVPVTRTSADKVRDALAMTAAPTDAVESLTDLEVGALRNRVRALGEAAVREATGTSAVTLHRALQRMRTCDASITRMREYVRTAPALAAGTVRDKLLVAALDLASHRGGQPLPFDAADLVVRAWEMFPESFSLRGFPAHPDSNRVLSKISGEGGLLAEKLLRRVSTSTYVITTQGVTRALVLAGRAVAA